MKRVLMFHILLLIIFIGIGASLKLIDTNNEQYSFDEVAEQCSTCIDEWFFDDTTERSEFCTDILIFDEQCRCSLAVNKFGSLKNPTFEQRMIYTRINHFIEWYLLAKAFDGD